MLYQEIVTQDQFRNTYESKRYKNEGCETLDRYDIFPLNYLNPKSRVLNTLGFYSYFSGSITVGNKIRANGRISTNDEAFDSFRTFWDEELGLTLKNQKTYYSFGVYGGTYSRLLSSMGFYASSAPNPLRHVKKAGVGTTLPKYIKDIVENYDSKDFIMRQFFKPYLDDLLDVLIRTKVSNKKYSSLRLNMLSQPSKEKLITESQLIADILKIVYPEVNIEIENDLKTGVLISKDREVHFGNLYFSQNQINTLQEEKSPLIEKLFNENPHNNAISKINTSL
ncbi:MAG: hypothetical protein PF569_04560 [Candidatus Woesearchaeota archaeon]|nr:hypothetical protein [Candidatus Woesearchaeota archaeon]